MTTHVRRLPVLACLGALLLAWHPALAGTRESARRHTTMRVEQNTITFDYKVTYVEYAVGEWLGVTVEYSATCPVVFKGLTLRQPAPFFPSGQVTGAIANVSGTPMAGQAAKTGSATFDIHFTTLNKTATGDADGVDRSATIRVEIDVTTGARSGAD